MGRKGDGGDEQRRRLRKLVKSGKKGKGFDWASIIATAEDLQRRDGGIGLPSVAEDREGRVDSHVRGHGRGSSTIGRRLDEINNGDGLVGGDEEQGDDSASLVDDTIERYMSYESRRAASEREIQDTLSWGGVDDTIDLLPARVPTFDIKGNFVNFKTRTGDVEVSATQESTASRTGSDESASHRNKPPRDRRYTMMFALLLIFDVVILALYLAGRSGNESATLASPDAAGFQAVDEALPSSDPIETDPSIEIEHGHGHTHPKKHHKPKNPEHTHPLKDHAPRNEPEEKHTHPKKEHNKETEESAVASDLSGYEMRGDGGGAVRIAPSIVASSRETTPEARTEQIVVDGDEHVSSYLKFDISALTKDDVVDAAVLKLQLASHSEDLASLTVRVHSLLSSGDWAPSQFASLGSMESLPVASFSVDPSEGEAYEVDVSAAIELTRDWRSEWATVRLSAESSGWAQFASEDADGGAAAPELAITLAP